MSESDKEKIWRRLARLTARKVNFGWWLDKLTPLLIVLGLTVATAIILLRSFGRPVADNPWFYGGAGLALTLILLTAWLMARRHFIAETDGLVRLEDRLRMKNALTTAERGVGPWPKTPGEDHPVNSGLDWNWVRVATPFLILLAVVTTSLLIPITSVEGAKGPPSEPLAWEQMDEWMATLQVDEVVEESAIEEVREKIQELRGQPEQEWFSHSSLEATDNLRQTLNQQIQTIGAELTTAERDLNALQNYSAQLSEETKEQLLEEYDQALRDLDLNGLPLNSDLLNKLKSIDPKQLAQGQMRQLTQEQLDQMREAMKKAAAACKNCNGMGKNGEGEGGLPKLGEMDPALAALLANCNKPGRGGITRGPGPAPLFFGDEDDLKTNNIEGIQNDDFSKALPGALLGIGEAKHDIDETKVGPREAGAVKSVGQGGETIWQESLMPKEKAVLKKYFK